MYIVSNSTQSDWPKIEQAVTALTQAVPGITRTGASADRHYPATESDASALRQEIAQILRDELRAAVGDGEGTPCAEESTTTKLLNTPEHIEAYTRAHEVVRIALAARRWTDEDAQELRQSMGYLTKVQQEEILQTPIPALNRGEVAVETSGPPF